MKLSLVPSPDPAVSEQQLYDELPPVDAHFQGRAQQEGYEFDAVALDHLVEAGCTVVERRHRRHDYAVDGLIRTCNGAQFLVLAHGNIGHGSAKPGLRRSGTISTIAHRALMLRVRREPPLVVVTSHLPQPGSAGARYLADLHAVFGSWVIDVVATTGDLAGFRRLEWLFTAEPRPTEPLPAPWRVPQPGEELLPDLPRGFPNGYL